MIFFPIVLESRILDISLFLSFLVVWHIGMSDFMLVGFENSSSWAQQFIAVKYCDNVYQNSAVKVIKFEIPLKKMG